MCNQIDNFRSDNLNWKVSDQNVGDSLASGAIMVYKQPLRSNMTSGSKISDSSYLHIHVHIAYMVWALLVASEAATASLHVNNRF